MWGAVRRPGSGYEVTRTRCLDQLPRRRQRGGTESVEVKGTDCVCRRRTIPVRRGELVVCCGR